jgi:DNA-binding NarL/FixJ family response regulator
MKIRKQPLDGSRKRILIVDDHPLLRAGLGQVVNQQDDVVVCGEAGDGPSGLAAVAKCRPDAVIVDISLEAGSGLDLIKDIHARQPTLPILALSVHHENLYAERAIRAGAQGYVMKREPVDAVMAALRKVLHGQIAVSENIVCRLIGRGSSGRTEVERSPVDLLSDRELEVFRLFGEGCGTRQIAGRLRLAASTVESYRAAIKQKLGLSTGTELIASAARFIASQSGG